MKTSKTREGPRLPLCGSVATLIASLYSGTPLAAQTDWMLMSRHGECHEIDLVLRRKFDGLPPITSPDVFADAMRNLGVATRIAGEPVQPGGAVIVELPDKAMTLIFVRRTGCASIVERGR